jgi:hypothetical protein
MRGEEVVKVNSEIGDVTPDDSIGYVIGVCHSPSPISDLKHYLVVWLRDLEVAALTHHSKVAFTGVKMWVTTSKVLEWHLEPYRKLRAIGVKIDLFD